MVGSVNQATGTSEFKEDSKIGNQSEVRNSLQRVRTIPAINVTIDSRSGLGQVPRGADESPNLLRKGSIVLV